MTHNPSTHHATRPGDWRALYEAKTTDVTARMAAIKGRLRGSYAVDKAQRARHAARTTDFRPPQKRARGGGAAGATGGRGGVGGGGGSAGVQKIMGRSSEWLGLLMGGWGVRLACEGVLCVQCW